VGRGVTKARPPPQLVENLLQFRAARNDYTNVDRAKVEQQTAPQKILCAFCPSLFEMRIRKPARLIAAP
jgi:hypothetical protein